MANSLTGREVAEKSREHNGDEQAELEAAAKLFIINIISEQQLLPMPVAKGVAMGVMAVTVVRLTGRGVGRAGEWWRFPDDRRKSHAKCLILEMLSSLIMCLPRT